MNGEYRLTVSSALSLSRVVLAVPAWYCIVQDFSGSRTAALLLIGVAVATDFLDGYTARRLHQVTELGKIVDPVADKIAVGIVALALLMRGEIETWYVVLVVVRDVLIVIGGLLIQRKKKIITQSNWPGKFAVSFVALTLVLSAAHSPALNALRAIVLWSSVILMSFSFGLYAQRLFIGRRAVKE